MKNKGSVPTGTYTITNMFFPVICVVKNKSRIREGGRQAGREPGENIGRGSEGRKKSKPLTFNT